MTLTTEKEWQFYLQKTLRREMGKALLKPTKLAVLLKIRPDTLAKKIRRGGFSAGFLFQALEVIGVDQINIKDIKEKESALVFRDAKRPSPTQR